MTDFKQRTETYRQEERAHLKGAFHCRKEGAWAWLLKPLIRGRTTASRTSKATLLTYPAQRQPSRSAAGTENERDEGDPSPVTAKGLKQPPSAGGQRRSPASFFPPSSFPRGPGGARPSAAGPGVPGGQPRSPRSAPLRASCRLPGKLRAAGSPIFLGSMRGVRRGGGVSASGWSHGGRAARAD